MNILNPPYNFETDCKDFKHDLYLTENQIKFLGNPTEIHHIPQSEDFHLKGILGMHQVITQLGFWDRLDERNINFKKFGPKIDEAGHSGFTFSFTFFQMKYIAVHGWKDWVAMCEKKYFSK